MLRVQAGCWREGWGGEPTVVMRGRRAALMEGTDNRFSALNVWGI